MVLNVVCWQRMCMYVCEVGWCCRWADKMFGKKPDEVFDQAMVLIEPAAVEVEALREEAASGSETRSRAGSTSVRNESPIRIDSRKRAEWGEASVRARSRSASREARSRSTSEVQLPAVDVKTETEASANLEVPAVEMEASVSVEVSSISGEAALNVEVPSVKAEASGGAEVGAVAAVACPLPERCVWDGECSDLCVCGGRGREREPEKATKNS